jgi:hypothetical protein
LYDFGKSKSVPLKHFSGLYCVTNLTSSFSGGVFKQVLKGFRRPLYGDDVESTPDQMFGISNKKEEPPTADPDEVTP